MVGKLLIWDLVFYKLEDILVILEVLLILGQRGTQTKTLYQSASYGAVNADIPRISFNFLSYKYFIHII